MGKRSAGSFERNKGDFYRTWHPATVAPLARRLGAGAAFVEPCAGDRILAHNLETMGLQCLFASDVEPQDRSVGIWDAMDLTPELLAGWLPTQVHRLKIITNPPWTRTLLHRMIAHFQEIADTWLLFDADWAHTDQAIPLLESCHEIIGVGRVKWMEGSRHSGKDNAAWYNFDARRRRSTHGPVFVNGRVK